MTDKPYTLARQALGEVSGDVHNGARHAVSWPDFKGEVGFQDKGNIIQASYFPDGGDRPKVGDLREIDGARYRVISVGRNAYVSGMTTLDLEVV